LGPFALQSATQHSGNWTQLYAGVTLVVVPTLIAFIILSERIIARMTAGAVK
jgi:ABC-type glycerol-3-phosphate transport system permease component